MTRIGFLAWIGTVVLMGCSDSSSDSKKDGLPTSFGDCDASQCEVALSAFSDKPGTIPYCPKQQTDLELSCTTSPNLSAATCGELFAARFVYAFTGDFYQCIYQGGALVGAKWSPDNHPTQVAGTPLPDDCALTAQCADGGSDSGAD